MAGSPRLEDHVSDDHATNGTGAVTGSSPKNQNATETASEESEMTENTQERSEMEVIAAGTPEATEATKDGLESGKSGNEALDSDETLAAMPPLPDDLISELRARIEELGTVLEAGLNSIHTSFEAKLRYDSFKDEQVRKLDSELQAHKVDLLAKATKPLLHGIIRLHTDIGRTVEALRRKDPVALTVEGLLDRMEGFQDDVEILLEDHGVMTFRETSDTFNPHRQTAVRTEPTDDPALAGQVHLKARPGFEQDEKILQKEQVVVFKLSPRSAVPVASTPTENEPHFSGEEE
jgi:molecular chaperone GrpE (heat shock protein)